MSGDSNRGDQAADHFRAWAGAMLARHRHRAQPGTVYQTSTMAALLDGIYDGDVTIAELLTHGDFGLGTFNHLDGEMVILDGTCYHLRADGSARVAAPQDMTPFAAVLWFRPDKTINVTSQSDRAALTGSSTAPPPARTSPMPCGSAAASPACGPVPSWSSGNLTRR